MAIINPATKAANINSILVIAFIYYGLSLLRFVMVTRIALTLNLIS